MDYLVKKEDFQAFLATLQKKSDIIAPVEVNNNIFYKTLSRNDIHLITFKKPLYPAKKYFLPDNETILEFKNGKIINDKTGLSNSSGSNSPTTIFLLPRCDINAVHKLDIIYLSEPVDVYYQQKRLNSVLIEIPCEKDDSCFCHETNLKDHYDIKITEFNKDNYILSARTDKAKALIAKLKSKKPIVKESKYNLNQNPLYTRKIINCDDKIFKPYADRCLSCSACTELCPTCCCFHVTDVTEMGSLTGSRIRQLSSCQLQNFTRVAGNYVFRKSRALRVKHRIFHKLKYFKKQHGELMCVGCGRCTSACPTKINIYEIWQKLV